MSITTRHKKAAKNILKYPTRKEAMVEAKYSPSYASSSHIKATKGWQELMEKGLPDKDLLRVHKEGLNATRTQGVGGMLLKMKGEGEGEFGHTDIEVPDYAVRHKYLDSAYKIKGKYPQQGVGMAVQINFEKARTEFE